MASFGQTKKELWEGCSPDRERFVLKLRDLISALPIQGQYARARYLRIPKSTLSCYWSGRRVPAAQVVEEMYEMISHRVSYQPLPISRSDLLDLRSPAASRHQRTCQTQVSTIQKPETGKPHLVDRRIPRNRRVQQTLDALAVHHHAGDRRAVLNIVLSVGKTLAPALIAEAVADLDATDRSDLAEAVVLGGRERAESDSMCLALALMERDLHHYAQLAMRAALPSGAP